MLKVLVPAMATGEWNLNQLKLFRQNRRLDASMRRHLPTERTGIIAGRYSRPGRARLGLRLSRRSLNCRLRRC